MYIANNSADTTLEILTCRCRLIQVFDKLILAFIPSSLLSMLSLPREAQGPRNNPRRRSGCVWHPRDWLQSLGCRQILGMLAGIWEGLLSVHRPLFQVQGWVSKLV